MTEPFIGEIKMFGGNYAPRGYAFCNGQLLSIAQNSALFAILGTTYGGDGVQTFALPNMQSRIPIHPGTGPGLSNYSLGQTGGEENHTLNQNEMPTHRHTAYGNSRTANVSTPVSAVPGDGTFYRATPDTQAPMDEGFIGQTGGSQPHNNRQPYLAVNFIIALTGIFPSRN